MRDRRQRRQPDAAAQHHDVAPPRIEMETNAERADHVEHVALLQGREALGAAADAFVEELDAAARGVDAVDALRPPQPQFARIGRRAQQVEELARIDGERLRRRHDHEMLVFVVDPFVGHDGAQRFFRRNMRLGRRQLAFADDERRRCKDFAHRRHSSMALRGILRCNRV
jgi:hypothetical protein